MELKVRLRHRIELLAIFALSLAALEACSTSPVTYMNVPPSSAPAPSSTASPAPPANPLTAAPSSLQFTATGYTLTFAASENGYTGVLSSTSSDCAGIATFSPANTSGPSAVFSIVSVANGKCHVNISDASGQITTVTIDVTTTSGIIQ